MRSDQGPLSISPGGPGRRRRFGAAALALAALVVVAVACGGSSAPTASNVTWTTTTTDVNGVSVSVSCTGSGARTVVLVSGLGEDGMTGWGRSKVPELLGGDVKVCTYDRPGLGASGTSTKPRLLANQSADLEALITKGALPPPVVLVAQGFGTIFVRQYAKDHLKEVAGLVLIDPPFGPLNTTPPASFTPGQKSELTGVTEYNRVFNTLTPSLLQPPPVPTVVVIVGDKPELPASVPEGAPVTVPAEGRTVPGSALTVDEARTYQQQLAKKSPYGSALVLDGSGTYAQYWEPQAVADAIRGVVNDKRGGH